MQRDSNGHFIKGHVGYTSWLGKKMPDEARKKMSLAKTGRKLSPEHAEKLRQTLIGRPVSAETRKKIGDAQRGEKHYGWKGDTVKYRGLHTWIVKNYGKADQCDECGLTAKAYDWANVSQKYHREREDWEMLCRRCHMKKDGRAERGAILLRTIGNGR